MKFYLYDLNLNFIGWGNKNEIDNYIASGYIVSITKLI